MPHQMLCRQDLQIVPEFYSAIKQVSNKIESHVQKVFIKKQSCRKIG